MKIAQVTFSFSGLGGIATQLLHQHIAFDLYSEHKIDSFVIVGGKPSSGSPSISSNYRELKFDFPRLSIGDKYLPQTLAILSNYDLIIFLHPCPHPNQTRSTNWMRLYDLRIEKITMFTDMWWDKYYPWIAAVKNKLGTVIGVSPKHAEYVGRTLLDGRNVRVLSHVFCYEDAGLYTNKTDSVFWPNQWKGIKGIDDFFELCANLDANIRVDMAGLGREYYNFRKTQEYRDLVAEDVITGYSGAGIIKILGTISPDEMISYYKKSAVSVDFTGRSSLYAGLYNRATLEPMFWGSVLVCKPEMTKESGFGIIPNDSCFVLSEFGVEAGKQLSNFILDVDRRLEVSERAFKWVSEKFSVRRFFESIL